MGVSSSSLVHKILNEVYNSDIVDVLMRTSIASSMCVHASQSISVNIDCDGGILWDCDMSWSQDLQSSVRVITEIDAHQATEVQRVITNDITGKNSQTLEKVFNALSGIGEVRVDNQEVDFVNRVTSILQETVTNENIVRIVNSVRLTQDMEIIMHSNGKCVITGDQCSAIQNISINIIAENIVRTISENLVRDGVLNRIYNDSVQSTDITANGFEALIDSLTHGGTLLLAGLVTLGILVIVGTPLLCVFVTKFSGLGQVMKKIRRNPGISVLIVAVLALMSIGATMVMSENHVWPFEEKPMLWVPVVVEGEQTGECEQTGVDTGEKTRERCEMLIHSPEFWGCEKSGDEFTGRCVQYTTTTDGPMKSRKECEAAVASSEMCYVSYGCAITDSDEYEQPPRCASRPGGLWRNKSDCVADITKCVNRWKCVNGECVVSKVTTEWGPFESESECQTGCI